MVRAAHLLGGYHGEGCPLTGGLPWCSGEFLVSRFSCDSTFGVLSSVAGYPRHRENRENGHQKKSLSGKTQGIWKFAKTQGIWFAQVVNSLILKVKDIVIFVVGQGKNRENTLKRWKIVLKVQLSLMAK